MWCSLLCEDIIGVVENRCTGLEKTSDGLDQVCEEWEMGKNKRLKLHR